MRQWQRADRDDRLAGRVGTAEDREHAGAGGGNREVRELVRVASRDLGGTGGRAHAAIVLDHELDRAGGRIVYRFRGRDLHLVLGPTTSGKAIRFVVHIDGAEPGVNHGTDVDASGRGTVTAERLYQIVRLAGDITMPHTVEIEFLDAGVAAYAFTFG